MWNASRNKVNIRPRRRHHQSAFGLDPIQFGRSSAFVRKYRCNHQHWNHSSWRIYLFAIRFPFAASSCSRSIGHPFPSLIGIERTYSLCEPMTPNIRSSLEGDNRAILVVGQDDFPLPIPFVRKDSVWRFDTVAGGRKFFSDELARTSFIQFRFVLRMLMLRMNTQRRTARAQA